MDLAKEFGIDWPLLVAQIVNFLIVFFVLKRFAYKPLLDLLKNREKTIKQGIKNADDARVALEQAQEKETTILKNAQAEARKLIEETKKEQVALMQEAEEQTRKKVDVMLKEARNQISYEAKETEKRLSSHISQLATEFLQKSRGSMLERNSLRPLRRSC